MNSIGLDYNDTHYIDNNKCQWQLLENYPNSDTLCIHGQYSGDSDLEITNDTHTYNKNKCLWEEEFSWTAEYGTFTKLWQASTDRNTRVRNSDNFYCNTLDNGITDQCYSLEEIVFGNGNKKTEAGWKLFPGGVGWELPENSSLTTIYKKSNLGTQSLDFEAMLDDKIFVNKCESNDGIWNYTYHDCEVLQKFVKMWGE